jgi:hypothetical protein
LGLLRHFVSSQFSLYENSIFYHRFIRTGGIAQFSDSLYPLEKSHKIKALRSKGGTGYALPGKASMYQRKI